VRVAVTIVKAISATAALTLAATLTVTESISSAPGKTKPRPSIVLVAHTPLTVAGRGFARGERVTLRALLGGRSYVRVVRASIAGRFTARFGSAMQECTPFVISAIGRSGRIAALKRLEIPPPCGVVNQP
jgi:hypothetical protein